MKSGGWRWVAAGAVSLAIVLITATVVGVTQLPERERFVVPTSSPAPTVPTVPVVAACPEGFESQPADVPGLEDVTGCTHPDEAEVYFGMVSPSGGSGDPGFVAESLLTTALADYRALGRDITAGPVQDGTLPVASGSATVRSQEVSWPEGSDLVRAVVLPVDSRAFAWLEFRPDDSLVASAMDDALARVALA